jgi:outer membrane protein assembly factor BamB
MSLLKKVQQFICYLFINLKPNNMNKKLIILVLITTFLSQFAFSQKICEWRNTNRAGIYNESNLLKSWPKSGPKEVWEYKGIGNGYGSPVFSEDKMFVLGEIDNIGYLFAFDLEGKLLWKVDYGNEWVKTFPGSRSTPTLADNLIYVCSGLGNITCFEASNGEKKWSIDMLKDLNGTFTMHGHSESLVIDGDKVFLTAGGKQNNVVALNRYNGKIIWACEGLGERPAYNSPNLIKLKDRNILVTFSAYALMGIDTKTGKLLWTHIQDNVPIEKHQFGMGDTHSNTILYDNGFIYYVAGDGNCAVKLKLSEDGTKITEIWRNKTFDSYMGGFVKIGDYLFGGTTAKKRLQKYGCEYRSNS